MEPLFSESFLEEHLGVSRAVYIQSRRSNDTWHLPDQHLVLKVYPSDREAYFLRELTALHRVRHDNLLPLDRWGRVQPSGDRHAYWLTAPFVVGGTAADAMERGRRPAERNVRKFASALLDGLAAFHAGGMVHRDVKPSNVALRRGRWQFPVLLDPGIARFVAIDPDDDGQFGTFPYMAPEQLRGESAVPESDVFAIGVIAHELLWGRHPFLDPREPADRARAVARIEEGQGSRDGAPDWLVELLRFDPLRRPSADVASKMVRAG